MLDVDYQAFLEAKRPPMTQYGRPVDVGEVHPFCKPHQKAIIEWAVRGGRRAIFAAFGLGKSVMQLETCRLVTPPDERSLIVCPLGVRQEILADAAQLDLDAVRFVRRTDELDGPGIYLTNYESVRDGKLDVGGFTTVSLDEAAVLRSFGSKTYIEFLQLFADTRFRYVATATPSPNRYKELIHYAGFLGVMDTGQALTRFFQRDSTKAGNLTLYPHKEEEFWLWLSSWAVFLMSPADLGFDPAGYEMPEEPEVLRHEVETDPTSALARERDGQVAIIGDGLGVTQAAAEKRRTLGDRVDAVMAIVAKHPPTVEDQLIVWCDLNDEQAALERAFADAGLSVSSVHGSLSTDEAERRIAAWKAREAVVLIGKPVMLGQGLNLQQCRRSIFVGLTHKFNQIIQAIHRTWRYGQTRKVFTHLVYADTERSIVAAIDEKWQRHKELTHLMSNMIRQHGLNDVGVNEALLRSMGVERVEVAGERWTVANNDCVLEAQAMEDDSVGLVVTSIPFSNHYEYTPSFNDFGHTDDNGHFWAQMDFLTPELLRILQPGRIYACHVKDRILFGNTTGAGASTVSPFHAEAIMHGLRHGFDYMGMITVVTDVVRENNQSYRLGYSEMCKDGSKMGVGSPEYVLLFRKPQSDRTKGYADVPVIKSKDDYSLARWQVDAHGFWRSNGDRHLTPEEWTALGPAEAHRLFKEWSLANVYDFGHHVRIGEAFAELGRLPATFMMLAPESWHPDVWADVTRMLTLNTEQSRRRQALHVCLARDSLVLTKGGYRPIQEVQVGELVLTHKGRWRPVLAVQNTGVRPVVNLRAQGVPGLTLTPDHKVWARTTTWKRRRDGAERAEPGWVAAEDVVDGYVNLKLPPTEDPSVASAGYWWIVGRWLADGHIDKRGMPIISCGAHEVDDLMATLGEWANPPRWTGTAYQVQLSDPGHELRRTLKACGQGAAGKHLPPEAFTLPADLAGWLLAGYLSGDGHLVEGRQRWMASSVSKELLLGVAMLVQRVHGAIAAVYSGRPEREHVIDGRTVLAKQEWVLSFNLPSADRRKSEFVLDDGAWKAVRSADPAGEVETWNLRVAEDESYTAEGCVVKNCPLQFDIVDRLIERYSNPDDVVFDPFGGLFTVPYRAVALGRRGRAAELNASYFLDGIKYLQAIEEQMAMPSLFDLLDIEGGEAA